MRKTVIVLEGPDGSGKTTLANALVERHGFEYGHCGPPEKPALDFYLDGIADHDGDVVIDRLHVGSYVYGKAFRGMDDLTPYERWLIEGTIWSFNGMLVYANPPAEAIEKNLARGPDNADAAIYEAAEKRQLLRELYDEYMRDINQLRVWEYDYTQRGELDSVVRRLISSKRFVQDLSTWIADDVPVLGNLHTPSFVFVGDVPNGRGKALARFKKTWPDDPAARDRAMQLLADWKRVAPPFGPSPSGRYLHLALTVAKLSLRDYCIFNATQFDGRTIEDFIDATMMSNWAAAGPMTRIVALGREASKQLERAGIRHRTIPHPQFWKRFHYKDVFTYAKMLKGEEEWAGE